MKYKRMEAIRFGRGCWRSSAGMVVLESSRASETGLMGSVFVIHYCYINPC